MGEIIKENKMGYEPVGRLLASMSWPAILSMLLHSIYNIVDSVFVSMICEEALTAVSYAFPIQMMMAAFGVGTAVGVNSLVSRRLGAKRFEDAYKASNHGIRLALLSWLLFLVFGIFLAKPYIAAYTDDAYIMSGGVAYLSVVCICSVFILMAMMIERLFQATGNMKIPMISSVIGAVANVVLDPLLIFGLGPFPKLGILGAAIATVLGQAVSCCFDIFFLTTHNEHFQIKLHGFKFEGCIIKDIYEVAFSAIVMQSITSVMIFFLNAILVQASETAVAVLGAYFKFQSFIFMPVFGLNQGAMPIIGYNFGARKRKRMMDAFKYAFLAAFCFMTLGFLVFQIFPDKLLMIFNASPEMMAIGIPALRRISICFIPASFGIMSNTLFQATGHGFLSLMSPIIRQLLGIIPMAYFLMKIFGLSAVWYSFAIAEILGTAWALTGFSIVMRKEVRTMPLEEPAE